MRKGPGTNYSRITLLPKGTAVTLISTNNNWSYINTGNIRGYVASEYLTINKIENKLPAKPSNPLPNDKMVEKVLRLAENQFGKPYVWGAMGPNSFDCSGLTYYVFKNAANVTLPRTSAMQSKFGTTVSKNNLKAGDLIFFDTKGENNGQVSHVGIYAGNNQLIHASYYYKKIVKVSFNDAYWHKTYVTAKRVL